MPWRGMAIDAGLDPDEYASIIEDQYRAMEEAYYNELPDVVACCLCFGQEWETETKDGICRVCRGERP